MRYLLKRVGLLLLTAWAALTLNFVLPRLMPGNPIEAMMANFKGNATPALKNALSIAFGFNTKKSLPTQYFDYLGNTLTGHLGISLSHFPEPVSTIIGQGLPWTILLVGVATVVAAAVAVVLGAIAGYKRGTWVDTTIVPSGVMLSAMPQFWLAILFLYFIAFKAGWFPVAGGNNNTSLTSWSGFTSVLSHAALPGITLGLCSMGTFILLMRNSMITVMNDDYVKFAKAKGLSSRLIARKYAARNAILPVFTSFAMALGFVVAGAIFIEEVFSYPGIAFSLLQAVLSLDYPLMQGIFLVIVLAVLIATFLADLVYVFLDPRIRTESRS